jgi:uncharacterized protein involved in tolerance to divalent cations
VVNTERAVFVYTTYPSIVEAERAGRALVERRLCACVNILPGMISHYWWQGAIERGEEVDLLGLSSGRAQSGVGIEVSMTLHESNHGTQNGKNGPVH